MKMIIGGAFQGKTAFATSRFGISEEEILNGENCDSNAVFSAKCVNNFHVIIRRLLEKNIDPIDFTECLCKENPGAVIITNEIGSGIIPIEKSDRIWREQAGRAGCIIAKNSEIIVRVFCGIPEIIKGNLP